MSLTNLSSYFAHLHSLYSIWPSFVLYLCLSLVHSINYFPLANNELSMCLQKQQCTLICSTPKAFCSSKQVWSQGQEYEHWLISICWYFIFRYIHNSGNCRCMLKSLGKSIKLFCPKGVENKIYMISKYYPKYGL